MIFLLAITWRSYTNANGVYDALVSGDTFYLATGGGLVLFSPQDTSVIRKFTNIDGLPGVALTGITRDGADQFWLLVYGRGLAYGKESFQKYPVLSLPLQDPNSILYARAVRAQGNRVFVATAEGLLLIDTKGTSDPGDDGSRLVLEVPTNGLSILGDTLFACTDSGLYKAPISQVLDPNAWEKIYSARPVYSVIKAPQTLVGTDNGLRDLGDSLIAAESTAVRWLWAYEGKLYAGTQGRGVWLLEGDSAAVLGDTSLRGFKVSNVILAGPWGLWSGFGWPGSSEPQVYAYGLCYWDQDSGWVRVRLGDLDFGVVRALAIMPNGNVLAGTTQPSEYPYSVNVFVYGEGRWIPSGSRHVTSIKVLKEGNAFVGTWGMGVFRVDWYGTPLKQWGEKEGLLPTTVSALGTTLEGELLVAVFADEGKVYRITHWGEVAPYYGITTGSAPNGVEQGPWGRIWVATGDGLYAFASSGGRWVLEETFLGGKGVFCLEREPLKGLWIGAADGLYFYDGKELKPVYSGVEVRAFEREPGGNFWLWGKDGLFRVSPEGQLLASYTPGASPLVGDAESPEIFSPVQDALALDPVNKRLFVGTDAGVSALEGLDISGRWTDELLVFPNPLRLSQTRTFRVKGAPPDAKLYLYTLDGLRVAEGETPYLTIPESTAPGLYIFSVRSPSAGSAVKKVLVLP